MLLWLGRTTHWMKKCFQPQIPLWSAWYFLNCRMTWALVDASWSVENTRSHLLDTCNGFVCKFEPKARQKSGFRQLCRHSTKKVVEKAQNLSLHTPIRSLWVPWLTHCRPMDGLLCSSASQTFRNPTDSKTKHWTWLRTLSYKFNNTTDIALLDAKPIVLDSLICKNHS